MTRINVGIPPKKLTDQHLLAEHREIKRLCAMFDKFTDFNSIPSIFTLGTGHMKFFMDKGLYTYNRYLDLRLECTVRHFNVENYATNWLKWQQSNKFNDYIETSVACKLITGRISERILNSNQQPRYYGKYISKEEAIKLLTND